MPSSVLNANFLPSGLVHCVGVLGFQSACMRVAMVASIGPRTHCHIAPASLSRWTFLFQLAVAVFLSLRPMRWYMAIQAWTCSKGIRTLGSADALVTLLFRKDHWMTEVAHAPAPVMPVAAAMFFLHPLTVEGDMPTAVWQ